MNLLTPERTPGAPLVARHPKLTLAIVAAIGLTTPWLLRDSSAERQTVGHTAVVEAIMNDFGAPSVGPRGADVTIVIFTDYQCPVCRATDPALERLIRRDPRVRVLFKDWPIFGARSIRAARIALAADRQGKYWAMHRALMESRLPFTDDNLILIGQAAGIDWPRLTADLARHGAAIDVQLRLQGFQAWSIGLQGTPGYLIGPFVVRGGLGDRALASVVADARKSSAGIVSPNT